ncbi:unnamed protein product, partial [Chrysoparadoxa australica]
RYCNHARFNGSQFCGTHFMEGEERIPCPLDPNHTIKKTNLESHVLVGIFFCKPIGYQHQPY